MFKKIIISKLTKIKIKGSKPGKLIFEIEALNKISSEYSVYQKFLKEALTMKEGIENIFVDFDRGEVTVYYDEKNITEDKVILWINKVKDIGIKNYEVIEKNWESNSEYVVKLITKQLEDEKKLM